MKKLALACALGVAAATAAVSALRAERPSAPPPPVRLGPRVLEAAPTGLVRGTPPVTVLFDRAMVEDDEVGTDAPIFRVSPPTPGRAVWISNCAAEFRADWEPSTTYEIRVPGHA